MNYHYSYYSYYYPHNYSKNYHPQIAHNVSLLVLTCVVLAAFIVVCVFNGLASANSNTTLYVSDTGTISGKYYIEITPAGWTFSIWGFIYTWQALWIVYAIVNLFRKSEKGPYYTYPVLLPVPFLVTYIINMALNCVWMVVFDREIMEAALAVLFSMCVTLYICMFLSYRKLNQSLDVLGKQSRYSDIWLTRMLVQNGLGIYATWCTVATHLNLAFVLVYRSAHAISNKDACTIVLGILFGIIVLFIVTDWFFLDRFSRYTFTPYLVLVVAFAGSLSKNYEEGARNTIFTIVLLAVSGASTVVKIVLLVYRHCRRTVGGFRISDDNMVKA